MAIQILLNGLSLGAAYALVAVGFCLVFSILKFTNFAHGAMISAAAYIGYVCAVKFDLGLYGTLAAAVIGGALVGVIGEFIAFRTITKKSSSVFYFFVSSLTLGTLIEQIITIRIGSELITYPSFFDQASIQFADGKYSISMVNVYMLVSACIALGLLFFFLNKTKYGRAIRATSFDRDTTYLMGVDTFRCIQIVFLLAGAVAGLGSVFLGMTYTISAQLGSRVVVKGFISSVVGGLGSVEGAVLGGILLGIVETLLIFFLGSGWAPVATFVILLAFLLLRPEGLLGVIVQEKA